MSYLDTAWRSLKNHKGSTIIHIAGLTVGICACLTIYTITAYELSFDTFHPDKDRIYRLGFHIREHIEDTYGEDAPPPAAAALRNEFPGIEATAHFYPFSTKDTNAILTNKDYFDIFPYHWLACNPATALQTPFSVVLTETRAHRYFGAGNPAQWIGRQISYHDSLTARVTGVVQDWPGNTDFAYTDLISLSSINSSPALTRNFHPDSWDIPPHGNPWAWTFIKLSSQTKPEKIAALLPTFVNRHLSQDSLLQFLHFAMVLQPLSDIHFNSAFEHDGIRKANLPVLYGLTGAAGFILLLAIVNFINLSTAQSLRRARETNIRRILGSSRARLALQFLTETALTTILAALLSAALVYPVIRLFRTWLPQDLHYHPLDGRALLFFLGFVALTTLLAGIYPARILSAPAGPNRRYIVRKALIVFQFTISLVFIIGAIVFNKQLHFMLNTNLGFSHDAIITVSNYDIPAARLQQFARQARHLPAINDATVQSHAPAGQEIIEVPIKDELVSLQAADANFLPFYHIPLLAGHNLANDDSSREAIINDTYRKKLGFKTPSDALGHLLTWNGESHPIVGVIADFHAGSFHDPVYPLLIAPLPNLRQSVGLRLTPGANTAATLKQLAAIWKTTFPGKPFYFEFLDDSIARLYAAETRFSWLIYAATALAILISCLGLLGLILYIVERKKKEISIRKVLGAGVADIVFLLNKEFALLIAIALVIATPIAAYGMNRWLLDYAYRTPVSWWIFALAGLAALIIASLTISVRVIHAARVNPIQNLRAI